jgi:hypothetical protein
MMKRDGGLSLAQEHRRVRESSGARGNGEGCSRGAGRGGGWSSPFIGVERVLGRRQWAVTVVVMALTLLIARVV